MEKKRAVIFVIAALFVFQNAVIYAHDNDDFSQTDYNRAVKGNKNLRHARLENANLSGVDLSNANLYDAELENANLQGANLKNADLRYADLDSANLKGANISGAKLKGAELEHAIWVDGRICADDSVGSCR